MLCLRVPLPEVREEEPFVLDRGLVNFLTCARQAGRTPLLATDGGCLVQAGLTLWQRAAWAVAADTFVIQGQVSGVEQTPAAAERMAILRAAQHLSVSQSKALWVVDNQSAVRRLNRGLRHGSWHGELAPCWREVGAGILAGTEVAWIPSHGKRLEWTPPDHWRLDPGLCRTLNAKADEACLHVLQPLRLQWAQDTGRWDAAKAWSKAALQKLATRTSGWQALLRNAIGSHREQM